MKALFIQERGSVVVKDVEKPSPRAGEILVKMKVCGVCGTDIEKARGEAITPPVLGHEVVGEVAEMGNGVKGLKSGDRIFAHHHTPCYICETCKRGEYTLCKEFSKHNLMPGGFSEYYVVPRWNVERGAVLKLPEEIDDEVGTFIEPLGCCLRGLSKAGAEALRSGLIYGAGPVGLMHLLLLRRMGYEQVVVADPSQYRRSFAQEIGASSVFDPTKERERERSLRSFGDAGPELAIVATGSSRAFGDAIQSVARGGRVLMFGAPPKDSEMRLSLPEYFLRGVTIVSSYSTSEKETSLAVDMLRNWGTRVARLVTHRFSLADAPQAFKVALEQKCIKALVSG
jgi:L-iditol 2-dehydrogenase